MKKLQTGKKKIAVQKSISKTAADSLEIFDVVIIGGGAAGISAALWCDELGLKALLLEEKAECGGQLFNVFNPIKNHLGASTKNGRELAEIFLKQIKSRKFKLLTKSGIVKIEIGKKRVFLANGNAIAWRFLIIATGVRRRKLGAEGEEKFKNRGVIESGKRDAESVRNKRAAIIGGGDAALENALILAEKASEVMLVHRRKEFRGRTAFLDAARKNPKIKIFIETIVTKFIGGEKLEALELKNLKTKKVFILPFEAVLLRIGVKPNTEILRGKLKLDEQGYVKVNANCEASAENVLAIGDVANPIAPTVSSAVGMGATAAKVIYSKLNIEN